jgi:PKD repeat protein
LNDYKVSALNSNTQPDSSFHIGSYSYYSVGAIDTVYNAMFTSSYTNGTPQTYTWTFGDGTTAIGTGATQSHTYAALGSYNVCVAISGSGGVSSVCNTVNISSPAVTPKIASLSCSSTGNVINFNASTSGFTPGKYTWSFGDGVDSSVVSFSISSNITHTYAASGLYHISLVVKDSTLLDSIMTNYNASTATYTASAANFSFGGMTPVVTTGSNLRLSDVTVNWTDASGIIYTTNNNAPQPASSYFKILSEEPYQNNLNNQLTRKLHVNFSCTLYSGSGTTKQITNADAVIDMAYK